MRRLFFVGTHLDEVAEIVYRLEDAGIGDQQVFVVCRNEMALRRRYLHCGKSLDNTRIVAAAKRSNIFACIGLVCYLLVALLLVPYSAFLSPTNAVLALLVFGLVKAAVLVAGGMYDNYFLGVFNNKLDQGDVIIVIDTKARQYDFVCEVCAEYESMTLLVDSSNFASPLPVKKYIRRQLPKAA